VTRAFASPSVPRPDERNTRKLTQIWQDLLGVEPIEPDQNYFDLGGDSSLAVQMFSRIETEFHVKLPLVTLYEAPTIEEMERLLKADVPSSGWSPLVPIQPNGSRPPLFFFHGAGGTVLTYRKLSTCLGADQPFYGLQCQGLDGQLPLLTTVEEMAALYVRHIRSVQPHGPYFLGGYCMGGTLAYEAAQQLYAAGEPVALLALLDTMNWHKVPLNFWSRTLPTKPTSFETNPKF
jgi:phthiocerol/phenolphthiocerol synthesis type-I polyketide synthase E